MFSNGNDIMKVYKYLQQNFRFIINHFIFGNIVFSFNRKKA